MNLNHFSKEKDQGYREECLEAVKTFATAYRHVLVQDGWEVQICYSRQDESVKIVASKGRPKYVEFSYFDGSYYVESSKHLNHLSIACPDQAIYAFQIMCHRIFK